MNQIQAAEYGIDYGAGLRNCMNSEPFFRKIMDMFLTDTCYDRARAAYEARDYQELFRCLHELKGVSGNAGLSALYMETVPLVDLLRVGTYEDQERIDMMFRKIREAYGNVCRGAMAIVAEAQDEPQSGF